MLTIMAIKCGKKYNADGGAETSLLRINDRVMNRTRRIIIIILFIERVARKLEIAISQNRMGEL